MISHFFLPLSFSRETEGWERLRERKRVRKEWIGSFCFPFFPPAFSCSLHLWMVSSEFPDTKERIELFLNPFMFNYHNHQGFAASFQNECAYGSHPVCNSVVVVDLSCCFPSMRVCVNRAFVVVFLSRDSTRRRALENVPLPRWGPQHITAEDARTSLPKFIRSLYLSSIPPSCKWKDCQQKTFPWTTAQLQSLSRPRPVNHSLSCQSPLPPTGSALENNRLRGCFWLAGGREECHKDPVTLYEFEMKVFVC